MRCEIIVKAFRNHIIQKQSILPRNRITVPGSVLRNREAGQTSDPRASTPTAQPSQSTDFILFHKTLFPQNQGRSHEALFLWWPLVFPCCTSLMSFTTPRWPESDAATITVPTWRISFLNVRTIPPRPQISPKFLEGKKKHTHKKKP